MTRKIDARFVSALLVGLLAFLYFVECVCRNTFRKKTIVVVHDRYYLYYPAPHSFPSVSRPLSDGHQLCYLPSDGCDNNHSITN